MTRLIPSAYVLPGSGPDQRAPDMMPIEIVRRGATEAGQFNITADVWAVVKGGGSPAWCLGRNGKWTLEPTPSNRTDRWKADHRFTLEEAKRLVKDLTS